MRLLNFTLIKLTIGLVTGILLAYCFTISKVTSLYITIILTSITAIAFFALKQKQNYSIWFGILSLLTIISIGVLTTNLHDESKNKKHYTQYALKHKLITFKIRKQLKPDRYNNKYIVDILKIDSTKTTGKALLNLLKDSINETLKVDAIFITSEVFKDIKGVTQPFQFNYKKYLNNQYVYKQLYVKPDRLFRVSDKTHTLLGYANIVRTTINNKLRSYFKDNNVIAIINALILGQRNGLDNNIYNHYVNAGAVHILAVSGLHVGIILLFLNFLLKPLKRIKHGNIIVLILLVLLLWCFAVIAGLSASVTRAVTMFSIIAVGMCLKRPSNIYNTLVISVFVLLLWKPLFLFDVGFQLSYFAVTTIVAIQPKLAELWQPKGFVFSRLWTYFTVGIAAQIGVLPLGLYYFHQFSGLFFITNLLVIPFLGFVLGFIILAIILAFVNGLPQFMVEILSAIIINMNNLMQWLSEQDSFVFKAISFSFFQLLFAYALLIFIYKLSIKFSYKRLCFTLLSVILFQVSFLYNDYKNSTNLFTVFNKSRYTIIGDKKGSKLTLHTNLDSIQQFYSLKNYKTEYNIKTIKHSSLTSIFKIKSKHLLVIDSFGIYNVKTFNPDYVLLTQSPKINLNRVIDSINPKLIIADASNYKSYIKRWKATCLKQKIPFHYTGEKGVFVFKE